MRAPQPRAFLYAAVLVASPLACTKNQSNTNVKFADGEGGSEQARAKPDGPGRDVARAPIQTIQLSGSVVDIADMLDAASTLFAMWSPPEPGAPPHDFKVDLDVLLTSQGFGPSFLNSIDLAGVHAAEFVFPHDDQPGSTNEDIELRASLSALQPVRMIESLPAGLRLQPIGQDVWQFVEDGEQILFRAGSSSVEVAMTMPDLDAATGLRPKVAVGPGEPRIRVAAANLPRGEIDVSDMIPLPPGLARQLNSIFDETTSVDLAADFGSQRDLFTRVGAAAPFERLGLDPIGPASQAPSALAKSLPGDAMLVWLMPWGDPAMLHQMIDKQISADLLPAPFDTYVDQVIKGTHAILGQVRDEVLAAVYLDGKGQVTLVLAAEVGDEKAAQAAMRQVWVAAEKAFKDHIALTGGSPDHAYSVSFKQGVIKAGKAKADLFTMTVPKYLQADVSRLSWLVGGAKPKLEISTLAADGKLIVAIGAGQRALMTEVGRQLGKPGEGLEAGGGLTLARSLANGCQYCIAIDPTTVGAMVLTVFANDEDEPAEVRKAAREGIKTLAKLDLDGEVAFAMRLEQGRGVFGFGIPKQLLFADPAKIKAIVDVLASIEDARVAAQLKASSAGGKR